MRFLQKATKEGGRVLRPVLTWAMPHLVSCLLRPGRWRHDAAGRLALRGVHNLRQTQTLPE